MALCIFECTNSDNECIFVKAHFAPYIAQVTYRRGGSVSIDGDIYPHPSTPISTYLGIVKSIRFEVYTSGIVQLIVKTTSGRYSPDELNWSWSTGQIELLEDGINAALNFHGLPPVKVNSVMEF